MKKPTVSKSKRSVKQKVSVFETSKDLKNAVLIVSLLGNLFVLCLWIVLNTTNYYDSALYNFFINR
jgi:hypothetical protein